MVFDKVDENTKDLAKSARSTYGEAANLAVNQTLMRSINTSVIALLPVAGLLFVGAGLLGAGTLKDLALVLFVGLAVGTYSSIFLATPVLAELKEREPEQQALRKRVLARRAAEAARRAPARRRAGGQRPATGGGHQRRGRRSRSPSGRGAAGSPTPTCGRVAGVGAAGRARAHDGAQARAASAAAGAKPGQRPAGKKRR